MKSMIIQTLAIAATAFAVSCASGQTTTLVPSSSTPAAQGKVEATRGDNGNTRVSVEVKHLAPPQNVAPTATTYVVWARPAGGDAPARNLGALSVNEDRKGELSTLTPFKSFDLMVTPEANAKVQHPSNGPVLGARISAP